MLLTCYASDVQPEKAGFPRCRNCFDSNLKTDLKSQYEVHGIRFFFANFVEFVVGFGALQKCANLTELENPAHFSMSFY